MPEPAPTPPRTETAAPAASPYTLVYHGYGALRELVRGWVVDRGCEPIQLPTSQAGLEVPCFQFGGSGPLPLALRPTIFLVGGLDGISITGAESVLAISNELLERREKLPPGLTFVVVPWAAPGALQAVHERTPTDGRDQVPCDEDGDLALDEDGPDDVDADGLVLQMLVDDTNGPWTRASDGRVLVPARPGDRPRFRLSREGRDDDKDGRYNEDPLGGSFLDRSFPVIGKAEHESIPRCGLPLDDPAARALADLVLARRSLCVLFFQQNHGGLARPGAVNATPWNSAADAACFEELGRQFASATGRSIARVPRLCEARGFEVPGAAVDWVYAVPGAIALEVAAWGPEVERSRGARNAAAAAPRLDGTPGGVAREEDLVSAVDRAWLRWIDDTRGGIGFVDWHPVDIGGGQSALVGGFDPLLCQNAPEASLGVATSGLAEFLMRVAAIAPVLEIVILEARRDGDIVSLRVRVENHGRLPTGLSTSARDPSRSGVSLALGLPSGSRVLWGEERARLGELGPGAASREIVCTLLAPPGSTIEVTATSRFTGDAAKQVKP